MDVFVQKTVLNEKLRGQLVKVTGHNQEDEKLDFIGFVEDVNPGGFITIMTSKCELVTVYQSDLEFVDELTMRVIPLDKEAI